MNYFNLLPETFSLHDISDKMLLKSNIIDFNHSANNKSNKVDLFNKMLTENSKYKDDISKDDISKDVISKDVIGKNDKLNNRDSNCFYPKEKDTLFWCYYINKYGLDEYLNNKKKSFLVERNYKISIIDKIQNIKDELKLNKIKKITVEDDLMNKQKINIITLKLFMLLSKENVLIIKKNCYQKIIFNRDKLDISTENYNVIFCDGDNYYIQKNLSSFYLNNILISKYEIDNFDKPLKTMTSYKLDELQDICKKLDITIYNSSKNKTKQVLYTEILEKLL